MLSKLCILSYVYVSLYSNNIYVCSQSSLQNLHTLPHCALHWFGFSFNFHILGFDKLKGICTVVAAVAAAAAVVFVVVETTIFCG